MPEKFTFDIVEQYKLRLKFGVAVFVKSTFDIVQYWKVALLKFTPSKSTPSIVIRVKNTSDRSLFA